MTATATASPILAGEPFTPEKNQEVIDFFVREGYAHLPGVLSPGEIEMLRGHLERAMRDPRLFETHNRSDDMVVLRVFELDPAFVALARREPILTLMEQMLGPNCHLIAQNAVCNPPGKAIDTWHVDDLLWFPLPDEIPLFDPRMRFPTLVAHATYALSDIDADEHGPLQVVPGSHYSGRQPNDPKNPSFEGRGPVSVHAKAGDVYFQHPQVWHRGAPNTGDRTRYITGVAWSKRFIAQRFYPYLNYRFPDGVLEGADERTLRIYGKHAKGAYG